MCYLDMIRSYRDRRTQRFAQGERVPAFQAFAKQAEKRLETLDAAESIQDLRALRSNRLEALRGDREGQFSIRINASGAFALNGRRATTDRLRWKLPTIIRWTHGAHTHPSRRNPRR